jgi:hypothetical protein
MYRHFYLFVLVFFLAACSSPSSSENEAETAKSIDAWVRQWNLGHNERDISILTELYADSVLYYQTFLSKNNCLENKLQFFRENPDYYQRIDGDIEVLQVDSASYKASFVKKVTLAGRTTDYPSYLIFRKITQGIKLVEESDLITDKNVNKSRARQNANQNQPAHSAQSLEVRNGNIFLTNSNGQEKQLTNNKSDAFPFLLSQDEVLFFRKQPMNPIEGGVIKGVSIEAYKIMTVDVSSLRERIITDQKPFRDGLDGAFRLLSVYNPKLSIDKKKVFFSCEYSATGGAIVGVDISTGAWDPVFSGWLYDIIPEGQLKGNILGSRSEIRDKGRDAYYYIFDQEGEVIKEFDSMESMEEFRKNY